MGHSPPKSPAWMPGGSYTREQQGGMDTGRLPAEEPGQLASPFNLGDDVSTLYPAWMRGGYRQNAPSESKRH